MITWCASISKFFASARHNSTHLHIFLWIQAVYFSQTMCGLYLDILQEFIPHTWTISYSLLNAANHGNAIQANRCVLLIMEAVQPIKFTSDKGIDLKNLDIPGYVRCLADCSDKGEVLTNFSLPCTQDEVHAKNNIRVVVVIHPSDNTDIASLSSSNYI